jgi:hypothetical protein
MIVPRITLFHSYKLKKSEEISDRKIFVKKGYAPNLYHPCKYYFHLSTLCPNPSYKLKLMNALI